MTRAELRKLVEDSAAHGVTVAFLIIAAVWALGVILETVY